MEEINTSFNDLMDAKTINLYDIKKVKVGIKELDNTLNGGIPFGCMTIIGAHEGSGKSTLVSQILCHAMEDKENRVMLYSGEMSDSLLLNTLTYQVAGQHTTSDHFGRAFVPSRVSALIKERLRGRIFPYRMGSNVGDKFARFKSDMQYAKEKLGCNIFVIDNLMSIADDLFPASINELDRQSKISVYLAEFAAEENVCLILVAHTRKEGSFEVNNLNDTISGSSKTKNSASLILFYSDLKKEDKELAPNDRLIKITKNRLYSRLNFTGIQVHYDENCKRIYGDMDKATYLKDFSCFSNESDVPTDAQLAELASMI